MVEHGGVLLKVKNKDAAAGWIRVKVKKPTTFDLVMVCFDNGYQQPGWWTGQTWDCGKRLKGKDVVAWKRITAYGEH